MITSSSTGVLAPVEVMTSRIEAVQKFDRRDQLSSISTPTLVICAKDDSQTPSYFTEALAAQIPSAELVLMDYGGHACSRTVPDEFNEGLTSRKAIYRPVPHNLPNMLVVDAQACTRCGECIEVCPVEALSLEEVGAGPADVSAEGVWVFGETLGGGLHPDQYQRHPGIGRCRPQAQGQE